MMNFKNVTVLLPILLFTGCALTNADESKKMHTLASALTKLSTAVESSVRFKSPPEGISDEDLLAMATQHDPQLLRPFSPYRLKVLREQQHAIVLVCTQDGEQALLEDAGCTAKLDVHLWKITPPKLCAFTLRAEQACGTPK